MAWILDLDGVVWLGDTPIDGAAAAVASLVAAGETVGFATNFSASPVGEVEAKLARHGIDAAGKVVTSAMALAALVQPGERALLCGGDGVREALEARGVDVVEGGQGAVDVVVVGFHQDFTWDRMHLAASAVMRGSRLLATNEDATYPTADGPVPGTGAILAGIERATGVAAVVAGKPHPPMTDLLQERFGAIGTLVGDRPDTDGALARALGYRWALVLSGVTTTLVPPPVPEPDIVADSLAALVRAELG